MATTDLLTLDRKVALAARALDAWRAGLAGDTGGDGESPLAPWREIASRTTIDAITNSSLAPISMTPPLLLSTGEIVAPADASSGLLDPLAVLRPPLASWCAHLLLARELRDATVARASAARDDKACDALSRPASIHAMFRALARPRQPGIVPEARAAAALEELSPLLLDAIIEEETLRRELAESLPVAHDCCSVVDAKGGDAAEVFLRETDDEAADLLEFGLRSAGRARGGSWVDAFAVRRAADVAEGWPSALTPRWIAELARGTELLAGLRLDVRVDPWRLSPRADFSALHLSPPTGAWTFARALFATGVALRLHGRDASAPFAVHSPPHDHRAYVLGEAFLSLASTPTFHARTRGVARAKAQSSSRRLATSRLLERRHLALRVRLSQELARGRRDFIAAFEALAPLALGGAADRTLAGLLGAPGPTGPADDAARFAAFGEGDALARDLVNRFDDDWWRNPKAAAWIRDRCAR